MGTSEGSPARQGRGRPVGSVSERTKYLRVIAAEALKNGLTPIDVMLDNMRYFANEAERQLAVLLKGAESTPQLIEALAKIGSFRMQAQQCAVEVAPYVHPRLSAVMVGTDKNATIELNRVERHIIDATWKADGTAEDVADTYAARIPTLIETG